VGRLAALLAAPETEADEFARVALLLGRLIALDCVTVGCE
jgi:hypothetical protein